MKTDTAFYVAFYYKNTEGHIQKCDHDVMQTVWKLPFMLSGLFMKKHFFKNCRQFLLLCTTIQTVWWSSYYSLLTLFYCSRPWGASLRTWLSYQLLSPNTDPECFSWWMSSSCSAGLWAFCLFSQFNKAYQPSCLLLRLSSAVSLWRPFQAHTLIQGPWNIQGHVEN